MSPLRSAARQVKSISAALARLDPPFWLGNRAGRDRLWCGILAVATAGGIMFAARMAWLYWRASSSVLTQAVAVTDATAKSPWADFPWQPLAGAVAGSVALLTFMLNRMQKQEQFEAQEQEARFIDILNRIAEKDNPALRANAARRLGEMATQTAPGRNPSRHSPANYPFYARAASQLATALHIEDEGKVRDAIQTALRDMAFFDQSAGQPLLAALLRELAAANAAAYASFSDALGEFCACKGDATADSIEEVAVFCPFSPNATIARAILRNLLSADACTQATARHVALRAVREDKTPKVDAAYCDRLHCRASQLVATRDALAEALRSRLPFSHSKAQGDLLLPAADLHDQFLQGAILWRTQLQDAHLEGAQLQEADLHGADLSAASLQDAQFQNSTLVNADLRCSVLLRAQLQDADFRGAQLQRASLAEARLDGAKLHGATTTNGSDFDTACANFTGANWWDADFNDSRGGGTDQRLIDWLKLRFPHDPPSSHPQ